MPRKTITVLALTALATVGVAAGEARISGSERFAASDGSFRFPHESYREGLVHLDSWFVPAGDAAGFHHVYTQAEAIEAFRATGAFPNGTVIVKELTGHARKNYTTGSDVASAAAPTRWFVMVKDGSGRHPDDPLWQEGWGWALFESNAPTVNVAKSFTADCMGCHIPARETDWVYVEGYPRLRR